MPLLDLLDRAGIQSGAQQVVGHSVDGFTLGTPLDMLRATGKQAMLAIGMNREALLPEHGFPMRTVVPGLYGYVSATKWLTELELATYDVKPYWVERGWDGQPPGVVPIKISSRIDAPTAFQQVSGGQVTVAGTAWAQGRGISRVEVRVDGGDWQPAELATEVNPQHLAHVQADDAAAARSAHRDVARLRRRRRDAGRGTPPADQPRPGARRVDGLAVDVFTVA